MSAVNDHIETICKDAGLGVMVQVFTIIADREETPDEQLLALTAEDVTKFYEGYLGPAIDTIQGFIPCTPNDRCDEPWEARFTSVNPDRLAYRCGNCGRDATPEETEIEDERRYNASLPDMTGYKEQ